jgi:hypothetical protein
MKSSVIKIVIYMAMIIFILCGCSTQQPAISADLQKSFAEMIPIANLNTHLQVKVIKGDQHKFGSDVHILVENISDNSIYLSTGIDTLFVKVFVVQDNTWKEIRNDTIYYSITVGDGYILSPAKGEQPNRFTNSVRPMLEPNGQDEGKQEIVRILVVGELMSEGKKIEIPVGAYVDLFMEP